MPKIRKGKGISDIFDAANKHGQAVLPVRVVRYARSVFGAERGWIVFVYLDSFGSAWKSNSARLSTSVTTRLGTAKV